MKNIVFIFIVFSLLSCGISKEEYEKVKKERDDLLVELDLYKNGEPRLIALIEQNIENNDFSTAKGNLTLLNNYHPESMGKPEINRLVTSMSVSCTFA